MPTRNAQHKSHLTKVVILLAVARLRFDTNRSIAFNGDIDTLGDGGQVRGVNKRCVQYKEKLLATEKGPDHLRSAGCKDNQDNVEACTVDGWDIKLLNHPPNSPDITIMCLGFFKTALLQGEDVPPGAEARHACKYLDFSPGNLSGGHPGGGRQPLHASPPFDGQGEERGYKHPQGAAFDPRRMGGGSEDTCGS